MPRAPARARSKGPLSGSTAKFLGKVSTRGDLIVRDQGHAGMRLADFAAHEMAVAAELTLAEVAALRLYSGPMFAPMNYALRTENIKDWATTISCCYSAVLKARSLALCACDSRSEPAPACVRQLSFCSQPARVYRGVRESDLRLPPEFLQREEGKFAGGVE